MVYIYIVYNMLYVVYIIVLEGQGLQESGAQVSAILGPRFLNLLDSTEPGFKKGFIRV